MVFVHVDPPQSGATRVNVIEVTLLNRVFSMSYLLPWNKAKLKASFISYCVFLSLLIHGIGTKLASNWQQNVLYQQLAILGRKRMSMLTGLKWSSLHVNV